MKGLYMVDADRGFVQYFENLLFTNAQEYRMLGHNFKANDFLTKIKERPDLLGKIDLLFINPKLNDLNGLELVKKVQSKRRDINICILVNENIKTFYENDIAELGIENVLVYPNDDEYYLNSVRKVFENIENGSKKSQTKMHTNPGVSESVSEKDIFAELNSSSFLNQFDFDSLSNDFFNNKKQEKEPVHSQSDVYYEPLNPSVSEFKQNEGQKNSNFDYGVNNNYESFKSNQNIQNKVNDFSFGQDKPKDSFITPNFGMESVEEPSLDFGAPSFDEPNFGMEPVEEPLFAHDASTFDEPGIYYGNQHSEKPIEFKAYENPYARQSGNSFGRESDIPGNPLDLSEFGVNTTKQPDIPNKQGNIFETPDFSNGNIDNSFGFGNSYEENNNSFAGYDNSNYDIVNNPQYNNPYTDEDFAVPYDNDSGVSYKSNLQNINRPDIDNIDTFENYGQPTPSQSFNKYANQGVDLNKFDRHNGFNGQPQQVNPLENINNGFSRRDVDRTIPNPAQGMGQPQQPQSRLNPYDEYSINRTLAEQESAKGFGSWGNQPSIGFNNEPHNKGGNQFNPVDNGFEQNKTKTQPRPFGGFDFSKPPVKEEPQRGNQFDFGNQGFKPNNENVNINKPSFDEPTDFDSFTPGIGAQNGFNNKSVIENMYNNTGVGNLDYSPTMNNNDRQSPIYHERTSNQDYVQVPDFAKQVVAFYSTKGGIGKTSLAVNSTIQLAKYSKKKICLIDFDVTNANVHTHLGILDSTYDLSVVSNFESDIDSFSLSRIVTPYRVKDKNGETVEFDVIVGYKEMKMSERFSEKEVYKILSILEEMYDIVIVDTHPVYTDLAVSTILKKATKIVFVTEQEMTALNGAKDFILTSKKYGIPAEKLFMVLNRYKAQTSIFTKNRIEKGLNKKVLATVPSDMDSLRDAVNTNNPVTLANPDSELARAYIDVAKIIDTNMVIPEEKQGFFKRFKR